MKVIAIYADSFNGKVGQTIPYMNFIGNFGIPRLVTPQDDPQQILDTCDALIIPGGADVNPLRYGEAPHPATGRSNAHYEHMDSTIGKAFIEAKKPVIGICRGMQSLNVMFGGSLYQHIVGHQQGTDRSRTEQTMIIREGIEEIKINSIHHQAVKVLGEGLEPIGFTSVYQGCNSLTDAQHLTDVRFIGSKKKNRTLAFTEAFEHESLPVLGFQYHPEEFNCSFAIDKINELLK